MTQATPSLSTDQVAAFVELARAGSLRAAADSLHLTEQGVRNRLVSLEGRLGISLYHKQRGPRQRPPLTREGTLSCRTRLPSWSVPANLPTSSVEESVQQRSMWRRLSTLPFMS